MASASHRGRARSSSLADRGAEGTNRAQQLFSYISAPFVACIPSTSAARHNDERQGLLTDNTYEDSDAISLLSNIADRSRRRNRASRRREQWNNSAAVLGCGLFGRPKGQIQGRTVTAGDVNRHTRSESADSGASSATDDESVGRAASLGVGQESGDEDAGMLGDDAIAELSLTQEDETTAAAAAADEEAKRKAKEEEEAAEATKRAEELERQATEAAKIEAESVARQKAEEEALAAQEEAEIAKARRRAERKAIKQGLLQARALGQREHHHRLTEAEAEAAAGGFDFAEEPEPEHSQSQLDYYQDDEAYHHSSQYGLAQGPEGYGYYEGPGTPHQQQQQQQQQEVVHHHHYYHEPQPDESEQTLSPSGFQQHAHSIPHLSVPTAASDDNLNVAVEEEDEDDADIAGLAFSKNRRKRADRDGSYASRSNGSGSGSRQSGSATNARQYGRQTGGSNSSAGRRNNAALAGEEGASSNGGGSANGKLSYRDRPRRHERTGSRSTGSGAGSRPAREGPGGKIVTSPTIPESDSSHNTSGIGFGVMPSTEDQADAAAGGFDDFLAPPTSASAYDAPSHVDSGYGAEVTSDSYDRRGSTSRSSTSSQRANRRREGPRKVNEGGNANGETFAGGLNTPRNPRGGNLFSRRDEIDEADEL